MRIKVILAILLFSFAATGQNKTFDWSTEACEYRGVYDSSKYSAEQLRNTQRLLRPGEFRIETIATVWNYSEIEKLDVKVLEADYARVRGELAGLKLVQSGFWENVRNAKLKEIDQVYQLSRVTMLAYKNPEALKSYGGASDCKETYIPALVAGGEALLRVWADVNMASRKVNSDPARLKRIFDDQAGSADRFKFALVETMSFGWWNCANRSIEYDGSDGPENDLREKEFRKLFKQVKTLMCEEP